MRSEINGRHMKTVATSEPEWLTVRKENIIRLPLGLLGFESIKQYVLLARPEEEPFLWLQMLEDPNHSFLVVSPFHVMPDYSPELSDNDTQFLDLSDPEDAMIINIVTLRPDGQATVNLKGPIVVNRHTLVARQVIPTNAAEFSLRHPIPVTA
jgi:flagellar assembly factor FliW